MDLSASPFAGPDGPHDLESLVKEANRLGLDRLVRMDDLKMFSMLSRLRSKSTSEYCAVQSEAVLPFDSMKKLSEKLLEVACAFAAYERETYE